MSKKNGSCKVRLINVLCLENLEPPKMGSHPIARTMHNCGGGCICHEKKLSNAPLKRLGTLEAHVLPQPSLEGMIAPQVLAELSHTGVQTPKCRNIQNPCILHTVEKHKQFPIKKKIPPKPQWTLDLFTKKIPDKMIRKKESTNSRYILEYFLKVGAIKKRYL